MTTGYESLESERQQVTGPWGESESESERESEKGERGREAYAPRAHQKDLPDGFYIMMRSHCTPVSFQGF